MFIQANERFQSVTKRGKVEGRGEITSKELITDENMTKLKNYFEQQMKGPASGKALQDLVLFNIIYFTGRRGNENLRNMMKSTFAVEVDADGRRYIHQVKGKHDKNHTENDYVKANEARIFEQRGTHLLRK